MRTLTAFLVACLLSGYPLTCHSLEQPTHSVINQMISGSSVNGFSLDTYMKTYLGFPAGRDEPIAKREAYKWLQDGGVKEDEPLFSRSMNHFHNPLKAWNEAGFKGRFSSAIVWAQDQGSFGSAFGGNYSWRAVREYYHAALSRRALVGIPAADNQAEREKIFAEVFQGIGQIMHLVQDMSVPAHTRDDAHPVGRHYEVAIDELRMNGDPEVQRIFDSAIALPRTFDSSILLLQENSIAPLPIAKIFDMDKYRMDNPDPNVTSGNVIGLSEYTNANFLSEGVSTEAGTDASDFPFPKLQVASVTTRPFTGPEGTYTRQYYFKNCCGETNNGSGYLLAAVDYLEYWRKNNPVLSLPLPKIPCFDDNVYRDYVSLLIPRAVGYSAGLLNYFFRGTIEITAPDSYIYSIADGSRTLYTDVSNGNRHQQFTRIKAKVKNTTVKERDANGNPLSFEEVQAGSLRAVARYKIVPNYRPDLSMYPPDGTTIKDLPYSYSVSEPISVTSLSPSEATEYTFDFTSNPVPTGITDLTLQVVFKGTLGGEKDIAVAVGLKDLTEPTHHLLWNLTDMFSLDGSLYTSTQIMTTPSLAARVDFDHDGTFNETDEPPINPHEMSFEISYRAQGSQQVPQVVAKATDLQGGKHVRLIVLTDSAVGNVLRLAWTSPLGLLPDPVDFDVQGVTNQLSGGSLQVSPPSISSRGVKGHFSQGVLNCYPVLWNGRCAYPESEALPGDPAPVEASILFQ